MEKSKVGTSRHRWRRWGQMAMAYLAVAALLTLGALYAVLPDQLYLEPGQELELPRHSWASPLGSRGGQAVASTRAVGSYQTTLALGGWLPIKTVRTVVAQRSRVTVCGTPFGVKMFSEGALVVGFTDIHTNSGAANPAKTAGLRLGDRVIRMDAVATENNDAVKAALEHSQGQPVEVVYVRGRSAAQDTADSSMGPFCPAMAGGDVGAGFLRWSGHADLCRPESWRVCGLGTPDQ